MPEPCLLGKHAATRSLLVRTSTQLRPLTAGDRPRLVLHSRRGEGFSFAQTLLHVSDGIAAPSPPSPIHHPPHPTCLFFVCRLIFVAKTTLAYMRKLDEAPAAPRRQQQGGRGTAAAAAGIDPAAVDGDCDTPEPAVRRRRTRRD